MTSLTYSPHVLLFFSSPNENGKKFYNKNELILVYKM